MLVSNCRDRTSRTDLILTVHGAEAGASDGDRLAGSDARWRDGADGWRHALPEADVKQRAVVTSRLQTAAHAASTLVYGVMSVMTSRAYTAVT